MLLSTKAGAKTTRMARVEIALLLILLLFGIPMLVLIPPGAGYDEEDHLVRVWELSAFSFIPGRMPPRELNYPTIFRDFAYRQQGTTGVITSDFWQAYARAALNEYGFVHREINTKSVYAPALLLPQGIAMYLLGRRADLPALPVFYACRLAGLLSYLILIWLAVHWMPFGKWILLILAVSPMALFQAATLTPDAISNGIGFLFIAGCLKISEARQIGWKEFGILVSLIFLLFLTKLNLIPLILLPFLLVPAGRFAQKRIYVSLLITTMLLFLIEVVGWNLIATAQADPLLANDANLADQLRYIASHPFAFLGTLFRDFLTNGPAYFWSWINGYGYYYWTPPTLVSILFLLGLVLVLWNESTREHLNTKVRGILILVFAAGYAATILSLYLTFTAVGSDEVLGVQGRYFVPLALLLFLALSGLTWKAPLLSLKGAAVLVSLALLLNTAGIALAFHVPCGTTYYQLGLCYRPLYRDFSSETRLSPPVSAETSLTQEIPVSCNGFAEVRVLLNPSKKGDHGNTRFILQDAAGTRTLLDTSIANDQISTQDWYPLPFEPDWHSAGEQYLLTISGTNTPAGQGLKLLYSPGSSPDGGSLTENGKPMQESIVLQYGCAAGLQKIWRTGKP
ncbi:MAG: DUF2142 domain-containing protein [Anaerolineales bacterium]